LSKCIGITRGGERCKGIAIDSSGYCYAHHPDHAGDRKRAARRGGKRGGRGRPVAELGALRVENADIRERLLEGKLKPSVAAVAIQSLNCDIRAVSTVLKAKEQEELTARLESLESAMEQNGRGGRWRA
jgi:hypothetical protein